MSEFDFSGRTVLVVGGSSGIGNGIAQAFRARGAAVHVWGTRPDAAAYAGEAGSDLEGLHYQQADMSRLDAVSAVPAPFDSLDVLVLAQGDVIYKRGEFDPEGFRRVVDVNLNSLMACCTRFRELLAASRGSIIAISSVGAFNAVVNNPAYAASKSGAAALVRTLGAAWAPDGIRVNGIAPGMVATKMTRVTTENPERLKATLANIPAGRLGTPADMAGIALFLASPLAEYIVGQTLVADGGMTLSL